MRLDLNLTYLEHGQMKFQKFKRRLKKQRKKRHGMEIDNKSIFLLQEQMVKKKGKRKDETSIV